ncbi:hypothetical protein [uncultured Victivallis sp.]|uniref:hypothetical protein n=1 Tax=uncultured Victivallis sp. TaxID=354118 RepID=UPI0025E1FFA2|nr:hypothetical protein [uncultured Victivallis sp.]
MNQDYEYLFRRRHALHRANREVWERSRAAYCGGEAYIRRALVRHVSEVEPEFAERLRRAYYFNYPRKLARLITQFILSIEPQRDGADPELVEDFSRTGLRANEVMRQFSTMLNIYGGAALTVEMPYFSGELDCERKRRERIRPAVRAWSPLEVADWAYGSDGQLEWLLVEERKLVDRGPFLPPVPSLRRKLFTRDETVIFERSGGNGPVVRTARAGHGLGCVPALLSFEPDGFGIGGGHYFEDVVRISDAILNNESEAQMNIVKQMFGLLVISDSFARGARPAVNGGGSGTGEKFSHLLARSAAIWESPEEKGISRYISPSGTDTSAIRSENDALKRELFDVVGMALIQPSRAAQTAEAKAWDHHQIKQFLASRVDQLEQAELRCWELMHGFDRTIPVPAVAYNREFAVTDLKSSIESLIELNQFPGGSGYRREVARTALFLLEKMRRIDPERREEIRREIESGQIPAEDAEVEHV